MKVAVVSESLPPAPTGQGMLIYRIFEGLDPERYCLISTQRYDTSVKPAGYARKLPCSYHYLPAGFRLRRGYRFGLSKVREGLNFPLAVSERAGQIAEIVRRERCDVVLAFTGDATHLPAAWLAAKRVGVPFFPYVVDHYSYREWHNPAAAFWARRLEPFLMKRADRVIVLNEALRDDLRERFGVDAAVIYNSFDLSAYECLGDRRAGGEARIVFTGDVYEAHYDAFHNLLAALELLGRRDVKLHIYTARSIEELTELGISGPVVRHQPLALEEMPRVQREADILFLPLAFNSPYPGVIRTSAPTKMGEYLAARRPILVHAPPDAFISRYFRQHQCGAVVDDLDPVPLARAIEELLGDEDLQRGVGDRAWRQAQSEFNIVTARARLLGLLAGGDA